MLRWISGRSRLAAIILISTTSLLLCVVSRNSRQRRGFRLRTPAVFPGAVSRKSAVEHPIYNLKKSLKSLEDSRTLVGLDYLSRMKVNCSTTICSELLTAEDIRHFTYCIRKAWKRSVATYREPQSSTCLFINGSGRYPMALASYPGSGNTWVRGLLQKTTGLCTGAIYCDVTLRQRGFPGESLRSGTTFVVKTHQTDPRWAGLEYGPSAPYLYFKKAADVPVFAGGIFILRNPFHAMVAEYKRQRWQDEPDNHVKALGEQYFGEIMIWALNSIQHRGEECVVRSVLEADYQHLVLNK